MPAAKNKLAQDVAIDLISALHKEKKGNLVSDVTEQLNKITSGEEKLHTLIIQSAIPIPQSLIKKITATVKNLTGASPQKIKNEVIPDLIGGFRVILGDWVMDASLKKDFSTLSKLIS